MASGRRAKKTAEVRYWKSLLPSDMVEEVERLRPQVTQLMDSNREYVKKLGEKDKEIDKLKDQAAKLQNELAAMQGTLEHLQKKPA